MKFEFDRVYKSGVKSPEKYIEQTSKINSGAGFDISSLVKKDVEAFTIVAGTPLKILKKRNKKLLELEWKLKRK